MKGNMLIAHGGGPTAVINASLYGAIEEAKKYKDIDKIYGAIGGTSGILDEKFIDLKMQNQEVINLLPKTPASALGTSRYPLYEKDYERMLEVFKKYNIKYVLFNGGNGSMDTCGKIYEMVKKEGINVIGIPKTIDNDIAITDHSPGFGSAARFIATAVKEIGEDVKSLPIHVSIIESMGRNAGWITAASALARKNEGDPPHLIYLPEKPFNEEEFLEDVERLCKEHGGIVVVASEGLKDEKGNSIVEPIFKTERATYFGDVGTHLATLIIKRLGIKARSEKPGILGRASMALQSKVDVEEAILMGEEAVKAVMSDNTGYMVGLERASTEPYKSNAILVPIKEVMMNEKVLPSNFITKRGNNVTSEFIEWCRPLIGEELNEFADFNLGKRIEKI